MRAPRRIRALRAAGLAEHEIRLLIQLRARMPRIHAQDAAMVAEAERAEAKHQAAVKFLAWMRREGRI